MKVLKNCALYIGIMILSNSLLMSCNTDNFTADEIDIIESTNRLLKVYTIEDPSDSTLLRSASKELTEKMIKSNAYKSLAKRMIECVSDSTVDGVGLAAPQIGILRRVVAVQRFDKEGFPFEVYPNISITDYSNEKQYGREGCLSVPDTSAMVERAARVTISYTDTATLATVNETIEGFTAVIFQHETDHLNGILYTDRTK